MSNLNDEEMSFEEEQAEEKLVQPPHPALSMCIRVKETVCPETFIEENKEWLEKLSQPEHRIEVMPHVFRTITKETIRVLPGKYNDGLYKLFRDMGDQERSSWCLQGQTNMMVIDRDHPIPQCPDRKLFMGLVDRLWMIGHLMNRAGNPQGRELERISWELRAFMAFFARQQIMAQARARAQAAEAQAVAQRPPV